MKLVVRLLTLTTLAAFAGCELLDQARTGSHQPTPAPSGETAPPPAPAPAPAPNPYAHLPQRQSYTTMANVELKAGCYQGDFTCGRAQLRVKGAGVGQTVIHGNLILQTQCEVAGVTVTGNVIFEGNQARLVDSDFFGQVVDRGVQNRY